MNRDKPTVFLVARGKKCDFLLRLLFSLFFSFPYNLILKRDVIQINWFVVDVFDDHIFFVGLFTGFGLARWFIATFGKRTAAVAFATPSGTSDATVATVTTLAEHPTDYVGRWVSVKGRAVWLVFSRKA